MVQRIWLAAAVIILTAGPALAGFCKVGGENRECDFNCNPGNCNVTAPCDGPIGSNPADGWCVVCGTGNQDVIDVSAVGEPSQICGEGASDTITGSALGDRIDGGKGEDAINGGAGDDLLEGGPGSSIDTISGGDGNDVISRSAVGWVSIPSAPVVVMTT